MTETRMAGVVIALFALAGCGSPEKAACEEFAKSGLVSPATYQFVSSEMHDEKITPAHYLELTNDKSNNPAILAGLQPAHLGLRTVTLNYDAANAYGTPIRNQEVCYFELYDGKLSGDPKSLPNEVIVARALRGLNAQLRAGGLGGQPPIEVLDKPCCL